MKKRPSPLLFSFSGLEPPRRGRPPKPSTKSARKARNTDATPQLLHLADTLACKHVSLKGRAVATQTELPSNVIVEEFKAVLNSCLEQQPVPPDSFDFDAVRLDHCGLGTDRDPVKACQRYQKSSLPPEAVKFDEFSKSMVRQGGIPLSPSGQAWCRPTDTAPSTSQSKVPLREDPAFDILWIKLKSEFPHAKDVSKVASAQAILAHLMKILTPQERKHLDSMSLEDLTDFVNGIFL